jgi:preprotein translocase subunit SecF
MQIKMPNIYYSKNVKFFLAIPVALMLISIYLSQGIVLDSSLGGGITMLLQTNTTMSASQISSLVSSKLNTPSPTIVTSQGSVGITIAANKSISDAENYLIAFYSYNSNYSAYYVNYTNYTIGLQRSPSNATLLALKNSSSAEMAQNLKGMSQSLSSELNSLSPFVPVQSYNTSNPQEMLQVAQSTYSNASSVYKNQVISKLHSIIPFTTYSYEQISPQQGQYFLGTVEQIIIIAFILISIVVLIIFRSVVPSFAIVFGAANDIIVALGAMAVFKIPLGVTSIAGLLMLLGYSIDTDVLAGIRILKRSEGTPEDRAYSAFKTGITMTSTAILAFGVLFAISIVEYVPTYYEIAGVVLFGLIGDILTTWLGNAVMILIHAKRRRRI